MNTAIEVAVQTTVKHDALKAHMRVSSLAQACARYFLNKSIDCRKLDPIFGPGTLVICAHTDNVPQNELLQLDIEGRLESLRDSADLFAEAEDLVTQDLLRRSIERSDVRYPVPVIHEASKENGKLLTFDSSRDMLVCANANWRSITQDSTELLKAISEIEAAGYTYTIKIGVTQLTLPKANLKWFSHGAGKGQPVTSNGTFSGIHQISKQAEAVIHGFRKNRVVQVTLSDAAAAKLMDQKFPLSGTIVYSETSPHFPLININGKVIIEDVWDIVCQERLDLK